MYTRYMSTADVQADAVMRSLERLWLHLENHIMLSKVRRQNKGNKYRKVQVTLRMKTQRRVKTNTLAHASLHFDYVKVRYMCDLEENQGPRGSKGSLLRRIIMKIIRCAIIVGQANKSTG